MDLYNSKGWKNRLRASAARAAEQNDDGKAEIRRVRAAIYQEQADADARALEAQRVALQAERCACPACGGSGLVTVEVAAGLLDAWFRYREQGYRPSQATIAALTDIANGRPPAPGAVVVTASYGMVLPVPDMVRPAEPSHPVTETVEPPKPSRPAKVAKQDEDQFTADGALIEV